MSTGYTRNDTSDNISNGNIINASDLDGEFNAIQAAFDSTSGHQHDGTTGNGAPILTLGSNQEFVATTTALRPKNDNSLDLGTTTLEFKNLYLDGVANVDTLQVDENAAITGTLGVTGVTTLGSMTATMTGGTINGVTIATSDVTVGTGKTLNVSSGTLTLADNQISGDKVEGGTINAITITTLGSTTGNITNVNATTMDTTNLEVTAIKAKDGTASATIANTTGVITVASSVLTTTDINGGTIDGAVIGGSSAAAITGTTGTFSGDLTIQDKIVHSGDANTSIRFPIDDTVTIETAGSERLRVTSTGNVGIGISAPLHKFSVTGNIKVNSLETGGAGIFLSRSDGNTFPVGIINDTGTEFIFRALDHRFASVDGTVEYARFSSSGRLGIGVVSPTHALDVNANSIRVRTARTPTSATDTGSQGEHAWDANYIYICTATNTWKRVAISTW